MAQRSSPIIVELITAVGSRFGLVVSEKVAAGAIPVVGAIGGAAVNLAFMEHFQKLAQGPLCDPAAGAGAWAGGGPSGL